MAQCACLINLYVMLSKFCDYSGPPGFWRILATRDFRQIVDPDVVDAGCSQKPGSDFGESIQGFSLKSESRFWRGTSPKVTNFAKWPCAGSTNLSGLNMCSKQAEIKSEETRTVSPPRIKRECSEDDTSLHMTESEETQATAGSDLSQLPPSRKRARSEDERNTRGVVQHTEATQETEEEMEVNSEAMMIKTVMNDMWNNNERTRDLALKRIAKYLLDKDNSKMAKKQEAFIQVGGHAFTVIVMKEHPHCKSLQRHGLWVLINLTYRNASARAAVAKVEGIQAILTAMKRFSSDQNVISNGFGALSEVIIENEGNANILVTELGGIPFLIERMEEFRDVADVIKCACALLMSLSDFEHLRKMIVDAKAITALAHAIDSHEDEPHIQWYARKAIKKLV